MRNYIVFDFSEPDDYTLSNCQIVDQALSLTSSVDGVCITKTFTADENITQLELRVKANQMWNCTYRVSNDGGTTWENLTRGFLHNFTSTGKKLKLEVTLIEPSTGVSPQFDKLNMGFK